MAFREATRRASPTRALAAVLLALSLLIHAPPAFPQAKPPPGSAAAICHECEWIRIQIGDIDEKIAAGAPDRTIHQISNPPIPHPERAKDIDRLIANLNAQKAALLPNCPIARSAARRPG
jgi:hypothetical protein